MTELLFKQGAEGRIFIGEYNGQRCLIKERFIKKYRHPELDAQITKERMRAEVKAITRCSVAGIDVPKVLHTDFNNRKIYLEYFENSITFKDFINKPSDGNNQDQDEKMILLKKYCTIIGAIIAKLHANHIIHGDLTTSNILLNPKENDSKDYTIVMVDFGLSCYSQSLEDKGVDLYVLERALQSTHSLLPDLFNITLEGYKKNSEAEKCKDILAKYEEVRARGRKRTMIG